MHPWWHRSESPCKPIHLWKNELGKAQSMQIYWFAFTLAPTTSFSSMSFSKLIVEFGRGRIGRGRRQERSRERVGGKRWGKEEAASAATIEKFGRQWYATHPPIHIPLGRSWRPPWLLRPVCVCIHIVYIYTSKKIINIYIYIYIWTLSLRLWTGCKERKPCCIACWCYRSSSSVQHANTHFLTQTSRYFGRPPKNGLIWQCTNGLQSTRGLFPIFHIAR